MQLFGMLAIFILFGLPICSTFGRDEAYIKLLKKSRSLSYTLRSDETLPSVLRKKSYKDLKHKFGPINQTLWKNGFSSGETKKIKPGMTIELPGSPADAEQLKNQLITYFAKNTNYSYVDMAYGMRFLIIDQTLDFGEASGGKLFFNDLLFRAGFFKNKYSIHALYSTIFLDQVANQDVNSIRMNDFSLRTGYENWLLQLSHFESPIFNNLGLENEMAKLSVNAIGMGYSNKWPLVKKKNFLALSGIISLPINSNISDGDAKTKSISGGVLDLECLYLQELKPKNLSYFLEARYKLQKYQIETAWDGVSGNIESTSSQLSVGIGLRYFIP